MCEPTTLSILAAAGTAVLGAAGSAATAVGGAAAAVGGALTSAGGLAALGAAGTAVSAAGALESANAQRNADRANALAATTAAEGTIRSVNEQSLTEGIKTGLISGQQRADQAAMGVDPGFGSPAAQTTDTINTGFRSMQALLTNGGNTVNQYNAQAAGFGMQASAAGISGPVNATSSILGGASSVASQWMYWQRMNAGGGPIPFIDSGTFM